MKIFSILPDQWKILVMKPGDLYKRYALLQLNYALFLHIQKGLIVLLLE